MFPGSLTLKEIDQIISHLQKPDCCELIKRLEQLRIATELHIKLNNLKTIVEMERERYMAEHKFGTSPVSSAYFQLSEEEKI